MAPGALTHHGGCGKRRPALAASWASMIGLASGAADRGRTPIRAYISVGGNHVHSFLRFFNGSPCVVLGDWLARHRHHAGPHRRLRHDAKGGDFYLATSGDPNLATSGDFFMATDRNRRRVTIG